MDDETVDRTYGPAARAALAAFPIDAQDLDAGIALLENVTFRVTDGRDGRAYVFRLHRPGYHTPEELVSRAGLDPSALAEAGIDVPEAVMTHDGQDYVPVTIPATGEQRYSGLASWTEGRLLSDVLAETADQRVEGSFEQLRRHHRRDAQPGQHLAVAVRIQDVTRSTATG